MEASLFSIRPLPLPPLLWVPQGLRRQSQLLVVVVLALLASLLLARFMI
jgi:integral membrane sensor domain MASE1